VTGIEHAPPRGPGRRRPAVTISDVARHAGVSPSAVSRALNRPGRMGAATEQRIRAAADELGYRLNPAARALQTGRTRMIAVMLSDLTNPVYARFVRGAEAVTTAHGYTLLFAESHDSPELEIASVDRLAGAVDGVVLMAPRVEDAAVLDLAGRTPVVVVNREIPGLPTLVPDLEDAVADVVTHLGDLGHRRLGWVAGPPSSWMSRRRREALERSGAAAGVEVVDLGAVEATLDGGRTALPAVLEAGVDAVVAYNDLVALGLIAAAREHGTPVPERLSVVGFDDIFGAEIATPALTTVRSPLAEVGDAAVRLLLAEIDDAEVELGPLPVAELLVRGSTAPPAD